MQKTEQNQEPSVRDSFMGEREWNQIVRFTGLRHPKADIRSHNNTYMTEHIVTP